MLAMSYLENTYRDQSGEFRVSPCYFNSHAKLFFIKNLPNFLFPKQDVKAVNLIRSMMASFIFHEEWTKGNISNDSLLLDSRYY